VKGFEQTDWEENTGKYRIYHKGKNIFYRQKYDLYNDNRSVFKAG
jgi:hypothetical protein